MVVQIVYATRELHGLNENQVGLCYVGLGVGTVLAVLATACPAPSAPARPYWGSWCVRWGGCMAFAPTGTWGVWRS